MHVDASLPSEGSTITITEIQLFIVIIFFLRKRDAFHAGRFRREGLVLIL